MAKTIKVIKCPTCGSNKISEIRKDYYKCNSCGVDFILDNDDININHKHFYQQNNSTINEPITKVWIIVAVILFIIFVLINVLTPSSNSSDSSYSTFTTSSSKQDKKSNFKWDNKTTNLYIDNKGNPILLIVGSLRTNDYSYSNKDSSPYIAAYNVKDGKQLWLKPFEENIQINSSSDLDAKVFEDGNVYIAVKKNKIYRFNTNDNTIENIGEVYAKNNPELAVGIAKVELNERQGSSLKIVTNDGKQIVYMPLINKVYKDKDFYSSIANKLPNPKIKTDYSFSSVDSDFPEEKIRLVKYKYQDQYGYPKEEPRFGWRKDFGGSGIFTDRSPYKKVFILPYNKQLSKVIDYEILTKDRTYFSPRLLASNNNKILIASKATPAEDDPFQYQILNANTGAVEITIPSDEKYTNRGNYILDDGSFIIKYNSSYNLYDKNGKEINSLKENDLEINKD